MDIKKQNEELLLKIRQGDKKARDKMIELNIPFVNYVLTHKIGYIKPQDREDFLECGILGLIKAVDSYKPEKGTEFSTYSARCIENEFLMEIRKNKKYRTTLSLDNVLHHKDEKVCSYLDNIADPEDINETIDDIIAIKTIKKVIATKLKENQASVLNARYFSGDVKPQSEVSQELEISQSYVSRLEKRGIDRIKKVYDKVENS